jgi:hypothetical protein
MHEAASSPASQRWRPLAAVGAALPLLLLWDASGLDLPTARWFGTSEGFPLQYDPFLKGWMHEGARQLGWVVLALLITCIWRPMGALKQLTRSERAWMIGTIVLSLLVVVAIKGVSRTSCPVGPHGVWRHRPIRVALGLGRSRRRWRTLLPGGTRIHRICLHGTGGLAPCRVAPRRCLGMGHRAARGLCAGLDTASTWCPFFQPHPVDSVALLGGGRHDAHSHVAASRCCACEREHTAIATGLNGRKAPQGWAR